MAADAQCHDFNFAAIRNALTSSGFFSNSADLPFVPLPEDEPVPPLMWSATCERRS
jgi:hypothetical protein